MKFLNLLSEGFALSSWYGSGMMTSFAAPTLSQHFRDTLWLHLRGEPVVQRADSTASEVSHLSDHWMSCIILYTCSTYWYTACTNLHLHDVLLVYANLIWEWHDDIFCGSDTFIACPRHPLTPSSGWTGGAEGWFHSQWGIAFVWSLHKVHFFVRIFHLYLQIACIILQLHDVLLSI